MRSMGEPAETQTAADVQARLSTWARHTEDRLARAPMSAVQCLGCVEQVTATLIVATLPRCAVGHLCELQGVRRDEPPMLAEVIGFEGQRALLAPLGPTDGLAPRSPIRSLGTPHCVNVGPHLFGRILDGFGRPLGSTPSVSDKGSVVRHVLGSAPCPTERPVSYERMITGVRAIDALLTLARGQRVGLFAGPGCGKTTLLGALARGIAADVIVFALVGERGRELNAFLQRELDPPLARRAVVVCATSDATAMERTRAAFTATAIAEGFCDSGKHVLLLVDSLTRTARAQREIGLASNEPPGRLGYPPSTYAMLPRLIERAGPRREGTITGIYTVLTENEHADPIADEARSLLDAHIVLSRKLAERGHFPAIDVAASLSRLMPEIADELHGADAARARGLMSRYAELEWLISLGEYKPGQDAAADDALEHHPRLLDLVRQDIRIFAVWEHTLEHLHAAVRGA